MTITSRTPAAIIAALLLVLMPPALSAQAVEVGPRIALGTGSAFTGQAGVRSTVWWERWGGYLGIGARGAAGGCDLIQINGSCSLPPGGAWEFSGGLAHALPDSPVYVAAGGGILRWGGATDPLLEAELGIRLDLVGPIRLGTGVRGLLVPGFERPRVHRRDLGFVELHLGALVALGGSARSER